MTDLIIEIDHPEVVGRCERKRPKRLGLPGADGVQEAVAAKESWHLLTQEEHVEIHTLRKRGWSYSAIARHAGLSRG